jgi:hypothetical protein
LIGFGAVGPVRTSRRSFSAAFAATAIAVVALLSLGSGSAAAATCPSFRVLHDDRIGAASFPAGNYEVTTKSGFSCSEASKLFARFLQDWDGTLPKPWTVVARGSGRAQFDRAGSPTITVNLSGGEGGGNNNLVGRLCPGSFTVNAGSDVGPLFFAKGSYLLYIPAKSAISCRRASVLFTRFLGAPGGALPDPWQVMMQTATFYKPAHPLRSAFRVEPANGV